MTLVGCSQTDLASSPAPASSVGEGRTDYPVTLDNCDLRTEIEAPPTRAVSLNQSATEILIRLGLTDRIVGTAYETDPIPADIADDYATIPLLTEGLLTHETLLAAQPDFVYSSFASFLTPENAGDRAELADLGVGTYLTEFDCVYHDAVDGGATFEMLFQEIRDLAEVFDVHEAGEALVADQQRILDEGLALAEGITDEPDLVWFYSTAASSSTPSVAGPGGLPQTVTELVGGRNLFDDATTKWPEVSWDEIAARDPDILILADLTRGYPGDTAEEKIEFLRNDPLTSQMDAVKEERFIVVPGQFMDPSVHSVEAVPTVADGILDLEMT